MNPYNKIKWTPEENAKFRELTKTTLNLEIIAREIGRSVQSVRTKLRLTAPRPQYREALILQDRAFKLALLRAIKSGGEKPQPLGVYRSSEAAGAPTHVPITMTVSGCSSAAAMCSEIGDGVKW